MKFGSPVLATLMLVLAAGNALADACNTARAAKSPVRDSPGGQWLFTDDGTGIEIRPCANANAEWCAALVTLPRDADRLPPAERALLCGSLVMGDLRPTADRTQVKRLEGWIVDPLERLEGAKEPVRHAATLTLTSDAQACIEVHGPAGIVVERYALVRSIIPRTACR